MSKQKDWIESIRRLPAFVQGAIGLLTLIIGFVVLFRDNVYLSVTVSSALILIATFLLCIYLVFAKTPPLVEGGRGVYRFEGYRILALVGIFFVLILVTVLLVTESSRSFVIIAFTGTATPTSSPTMTAVPHPLTTPSLTTTPSSNGFVIAISDFAGDPKLGSGIADEIEEALLSKIGKDRLNVRVLEGVIETQIDGVTEAEEIARRNSIDLIVWGKLIDYGNNNVKVIPKIYIANPIEDLHLRGRNLDIKIINPSDISLREQSAIDLAQFTALVLGVLDFNQGKYAQAIEVFGSITGKYEAEAKFYLGLCYYLIDSSLWDRAIDHIRNAVELYPDFGIAHVNLGMIYFDVGFVHQAYYNFVKAEDIGRTEGDIELLSAASSGLGLYYMYEGDYEKAETYFQSSLEGYEELNIEESVANQYGNLALAKLKHHGLNEAKRLLEKALAIHRRLRDWLGEANDLSNLGLIHRQLGDYSKALEYQNAALDIYENHGYTKGIIRGLGNVGINYLYQEDYPSAEAFFKEQLRMLEETGDLSSKAEVLSILGEIQLSQQEPSGAKAYFEEALAIYLEIGSRAAEAELLYSLALAHTELGETERAIAYLQASSAIYAELGDPKAQIAVLLNLVGVYSSIQNYEESIDALHRALEISKQTDDYLLIGQIYAHLGEAYEGKKDFNAAIQNYNEALRIFQETGQQELAEITLESIERVSNKRKNSD